MLDEFAVLSVTTAGIAFAHTIMGPDHYLPFVAMARAGGWSQARLCWVTLGCGVGHVAASALLGFAAVGLGMSIGGLSAFESVRGTLAAWGMIAFGAIYAAWGIRSALRGKPHSHGHAHASGEFHRHQHVHQDPHVHLHEGSGAARIGGWSLFALFVVGPCEPLIPLIMYPAVTGSPQRTLGVVAIFTVVTLATMLAAVLLAARGAIRLTGLPGRRFGHAITGGIVCSCGLLIEFAGL